MYGHEKVSVINGGLPRAKKEGVKLETGPPSHFQVHHPSITFRARLMDFCPQETTYPVPTLHRDAVVGTYRILPSGLG